MAAARSSSPRAATTTTTTTGDGHRGAWHVGAVGRRLGSGRDDGGRRHGGGDAPRDAAAETAAPTVPEAPGDADLVIWTDETRAAVIEPIVNDCPAMEGANIAVQQIAYGDLDDAVLQTAPRGTGPDLFTYAHDSLGNFVESGIVAPFDLSQIADQYQDVAVEAFTYEGQTYGLPYAVENIALFRNTDLVPEAPATFEELETIALQLQSEGTVETPLAIQQAPTADPYHNYPMYSGGGGYVFGDEPRRLAQPARTSDWTQRAGWRPPSCGRSGWPKASCPARCRRTS